MRTVGATGLEGGAFSSEAHFAQLLNALEDGVTVQDGHGMLVHANDAAARLLGFPSAASLLAADVASVVQAFEISDEHGAPVSAADLPGRRALGGSPGTSKLLRVKVRSTGAQRWTWVHGTAIETDRGRFAVNTFRDAPEVTEREARLAAERERNLLHEMLAESAKQESADRQRRLELALEAGAMGTWEWRITDNVVVWSPAIERMHGIPVGSFPGTFEAYQADMHADDRASVLACVERVLAERCDHEVTYRIVRPDGEVRWLEAHGRLVTDEEGRPHRLVGVCRDVTVQRMADEARARVLAAEVASAEAERARARLVEILESITDPFSVLDDDLRVTFMNEASAKLGGFERSAVLGKRPWDVIPESKDTSFTRAYERVLREKVPLVIEDYFAPWDRWFEASVFPLAHGISVYTREVTDRKRADQLRTRLAVHAALRADITVALDRRSSDGADMLRRCCESLVRHLDAAFARIWTVDEAGSTLLLQASAGMYTHTDGPHGAVPVGRFKIGLIAAERAPHLSNDVLNDPRVGDPEWARREGMVAFAGYPLVVDDRLVGVMAMFAKEPLPDDTLSALAAIADAIAQGIVRTRAEQELKQRVEDLARSNAELEQFAYVASHDLQEPLRMVASYNQLLARRYKGKLDPSADEFIGFTVEGVTRMQRLINDLLAYSRVGTRRGELGSVDMETVLADATKNLERAIAEENAVVTHDALPSVRGDEGQLLQLVQNLVGNAIKFHGDAPPRIHVSARCDGAWWTFSVQDNGIGIESQYFQRIFVIFQRLHPRETYPGTGIGLAICKKIVERHGGKIWVDSRRGEGSTVFFTLPSALPESRRSVP